MHQSIPAAPSPPPGYCGAFAGLVSPGSAAFANLALPGPGICQPRAFDTHAVSYQNITTQQILLEKQAYWLICQGREKIEEVCNSSLLIKPELHSDYGSYRRESTFFWLLNQVSLVMILFEEYPFIVIKLFIAVNFTAHY